MPDKRFIVEREGYTGRKFGKNRVFVRRNVDKEDHIQFFMIKIKAPSVVLKNEDLSL